MKIRVISDVHGKYESYAKICHDAESKDIVTLQIGDMGFDYEHFKKYNLSPHDHKFFGGNHDNYDVYHDCLNIMGHGDWGHVFGVKNTFFVRGAFSIDKQYRTPGHDWWHEEQLQLKDSYLAMANYQEVFPKTMFSHDCPNIMRDWIVDNRNTLLGDVRLQTLTGDLLQAMFDVHQPDTWIFGHWHKAVDVIIQGCRFICMPELEFIDIEI